MTVVYRKKRDPMKKQQFFEANGHYFAFALCMLYLILTAISIYFILKEDDEGKTNLIIGIVIIGSVIPLVDLIIFLTMPNDEDTIDLRNSVMAHVSLIPIYIMTIVGLFSYGLNNRNRTVIYYTV